MNSLPPGARYFSSQAHHPASNPLSSEEEAADGPRTGIGPGPALAAPGKGSVVVLTTKRDKLKAQLRRTPTKLLDLSKRQRADKELVLAAVQREGWLLEFCSEELRADMEVAMVAVDRDVQSLKWVSDELLQDRRFLLTAVKKDASVLRYPKDRGIAVDRDVVMAAVQQDGMALSYAYPCMQADRDIVLAAVNSNGRALVYASDALRKDKFINLVALAHWKGSSASRRVSFACRRCSSRPHNRGDGFCVPCGLAQSAEKQDNWCDTELLAAALHVFGLSLWRQLPIAIQQERELFRIIVSISGWTLSSGSEQLKADKEVVLEAVGQDGSALQYASPTCRRDPIIVLAACRNRVASLAWADTHLLMDKSAIGILFQILRADENFIDRARPTISYPQDHQLALLLATHWRLGASSKLRILTGQHDIMALIIYSFRETFLNEYLARIVVG